MEHTFSPRISATLGHLMGEGATASRIADAVVAVCQDIEKSLVPIVGYGGVAALYLRSLYLARMAHAWIDCPLAASMPRADFSSFRILAAQQTEEDALAGGREVLETFSQLLVSLIGFPLSQQLLEPVWIQPATGQTVQDAP